MNSFRVAIKKHWQLITFFACLLLLMWLIWQLIGVVLPFILGLIIAYLLLPVVHWLEKHLPVGKSHPGLKRIFIITGIYLIGLAIIAGMVIYMITVVNSTTSILWQNLPLLISGIVERIRVLLAEIRLELPASLLQQYDQTIKDGGIMVVDALRNGLSRGFSIAAAGASLILGFLSLPMVIFFMLKDWDKLGDEILGIMPAWAREHALNVTGILDRVTGRYIRGQIIMSVIIGVLVFILLNVLGIEFAPALAVWAAFMENVPLLGVWLSIIAGVAIALATNPEKALWLFLGYILIQLFENNLLMPRVQGSVMKMNPIFIILVSVIGAYFAGLLGFIFAVPVAATVIELLKYFKTSVEEKKSR